ncbi:unnamed protein product, partial [Durusdinium trenchii]
MTSTEIHRSKDGVPQWDGDSVSFQDYEEQALQWEQGIPYHKRYLAGPKLVAELSGPARRYVMGKRPQWLSFNGGVLHLLQHLRECLGRPTIPEMTEYLNKYFRHSRRRRFENMNTYITRKVEVYHRARQSLARVQQFFGKHHRDHREHEWQQRRWSQSSWDDWQGTNWQRQPDQEEHDEEEQWYDPPSEAPDAPSWHQSQTSYGYGYNPVDDEPWKLNTDELPAYLLKQTYSKMHGVTCLRCGKGHRTSECPEKPQDQKNQGHVTITEEAPFFCFTEEALTVNGLDTARTTQEAVLAGCAVIDGGATKTLGSVAAIQAVMDQNLGKHGESRIQAVDPQNQPQFGFGNGSQDKCISTTQLKVTANDRLTMVSQMKRADLIAALEELGESPPGRWTVTEMRSRLMHLHEEHGIVLGKTKRTSLQEMVVQLNKASGRKANLQQHCQDLGVPFTGNETKAQLQKSAMIRIYEKSAPDPTDPVGFGKGASLTYAEIKEDQQYCNWVKLTWQENPKSCCPQLARLAQWLLNENVKMEPDENPKTSKGYPSEPDLKVISLKKEPSRAASSSAASSSVPSSAIVDVLQTLTETVKELKDEIQDAKEGKRKGQKTSSDSERLGGNEFEDITQEVPTETQWQEDQDEPMPPAPREDNTAVEMDIQLPQSKRQWQEFIQDPGPVQRTTGMTSTEIHRSKDGVPQWDGDSVSFQDYEEQALQWEQGIPYHKRYLAGPKLVAELSGPARRYVMGKRPQWLSFNGGVLHLLQHLRECLGRPTIPEMTEYLNKYFRHSRRRRFENMNTYITRKVEVYHRARQSLARVQQFFGKHHRDHREHEWQQRRWSQSSWDDWQGTNWQRQPDQEEHDEEEQWYDPPSEAPDAPSWHQSQTSYGYGYNPVDDEPWKLNTD